MKEWFVKSTKLSKIDASIMNRADDERDAGGGWREGICKGVCRVVCR